MPDAPLSPRTFRAQLRAATAAAHARLDGSMAHGLGDRTAYAAYLRGMHAFVASVDPQLRPHAGAWDWDLPDWQGALAHDLAQVAPGGLPLPTEPGAALGSADALGALYVMEGSALGARVLLRDATALGYGPERGAAFLHLHAGAEGRWPRFLVLLEALGRGVDRGQACMGAERTFHLAERCFERARGLPA